MYLLCYRQHVMVSVTVHVQYQYQPVGADSTAQTGPQLVLICHMAAVAATVSSRRTIRDVVQREKIGCQS